MPIIIPPLYFRSRVRAYRATSFQTIPTGVATKVQLNAVNFDGLGEFDPVTNYRFIPQKAGYYLVFAQAQWVSLVDQETGYIYIFLNGENVGSAFIRASGGGSLVNNLVNLLYLAAGDVVEFYCYQQTGENRQLQYGSHTTFMAIHKLSE